MADVVSHYDASAASYSEQYDRANLLTSDEYPANYFRLQLVIQRAADLGLQSIFDLGMGDGSPLASMAEMGLRVGGCDLSPEMVKVAQDVFIARGLDPAPLFLGDIQDANTLVRGVAQGPFDAVMALGVLPHVRSEQEVIRNMSMFIEPGGTMFLQFRNSLLSLFSFNRLTMEFILDDLLATVPSSVKDAVRAELEPRLAMDKPPARTGTPEAPGYDEILSKFHNPLELADLVESEGFTNLRFHWYNYHPAPPMLRDSLGSAFRHAAMNLEHEDSWRGMFLCSAGVIEATKA
jgi:2-polyprenyl-3-methyl-5-hydroxy-6-metoxy-1,4-benzoquinol methylase